MTSTEGITSSSTNTLRITANNVYFLTISFSVNIYPLVTSKSLHGSERFTICATVWDKLFNISNIFHMMKPNCKFVFACASSLEIMAGRLHSESNVLFNSKFNRFLHMDRIRRIDCIQWNLTTSTSFGCSIPAAICLHTTVQEWHHACSWGISDEPSVCISSLDIVARLTLRIFKAYCISWTCSNQVTTNSLIESLPSVF